MTSCNDSVLIACRVLFAFLFIQIKLASIHLNWNCDSIDLFQLSFRILIGIKNHDVQLSLKFFSSKLQTV